MFRPTPQRPSRCAYVNTLTSYLFGFTCRLLTGVTFNVSVQLHFIESYLRESDQGFDNLSEEDQMKLKEELYVEVNR